MSDGQTCAESTPLTLGTYTRVLTCTLAGGHPGSHQDPQGGQWSSITRLPAPLDLCPKCGRGEMDPNYVAAGDRWSTARRGCSDRDAYASIDGECPEDEHLHERCTTCRYARVAWVTAEKVS